MQNLKSLLTDFADDRVFAPEEAFRLAEATDLAALLRAAARRRDNAHGAAVSYSRKIFIPLTKLCRDVCHYCTFAHAAARRRTGFPFPRGGAGRSPGPGAMLDCNEALFTLGDKPELRYRSARESSIV